MYSMNANKNNFPDNPKLLKEKLAEIHLKYSEMQLKYSDLENNYSSLNKKYQDLDDNYESLEEKYKYLQSLLYGKKSEKLTKEDEHQMRLFNEGEDGCADPDEISEDKEKQDDTATVKSYTRKKPGRKPIPDWYPRKDIIHDLSDEEKKCSCCRKERPHIGDEISEELEYEPAKVSVNRHIKKKYGKCNCEAFFQSEMPEIKTAKMTPRFIPQSIASSSLIAYIITAKFCDALPFYRQSKIFKRMDIELSRSTLCNWSLLAAEKCNPLIDLIAEEIQRGSVARMDETTLQVLNEQGKPAESKSYMWVAFGYTAEEKPLLLYSYSPSRSGSVPEGILGNFSGILQTDGYDGYNQVVRKNKLAHAGCFAHARREFDKAKNNSKKSKIPYRGLQYIQSLYKIESDLRAQNLPPQEFIDKRKNAVLPILEKFHNWLWEQKQTVLPKGYTGKAINYTLNQWDNLIRYLDHHLLTPDNNLTENAVRPFVMGRKNWLFSNTARGADSSAVLYSLIESAKANGLEPFRYLKYIFDRIPMAKSKEDLRALLPDKLTMDVINAS